MPFDSDKADRAVKFVRALRHTKGKWAGTKFQLQHWQEQIIRDLFGTVKNDGSRQYRTAYIEVPRKNGKSEMAAAIVLYLLFADNEEGAEVYSAAAERDQASLVFDTAAKMVRNGSLSSRCKIIDSTKRIVYYKTGSLYHAISADARSKHGFNAHGVIYDELHVAPNRDLWDVLATSMGAREQPLMVAITTAGYDRTSICWELHSYAVDIFEGRAEDPSFYPCIYAADENDDWEDEDVWSKANPNLEQSVSLDFLRQEYKRAKQIPAYQNTFRRLYLNQWVTQAVRWLDMESWRACGDMPDEEVLKNNTGWLALDLSSTTDLSALVLAVPDDEGVIHVKLWCWCPEENIVLRSDRDKVPYEYWVQQGWLEATPGNVVDYQWIRKKINDLKEEYSHIQGVAYDRWGATQLSIQLEQEDGIYVLPHGQGYKDMSPAMKQTEQRILSKQIRHGNNPVLEWAINNVSVVSDPSENIKADKSKSTERIDPAIALIMAVGTVVGTEKTESKYETEGMTIL